MSIERWDIDRSVSRFHFSVRNFVLATARGRFRRWRGKVLVPDGDFSRATADILIDASSIDTGVVRRDEDLRRADYLDVERYPNITFAARLGKGDADGRLRAVGALTIRGVTRDVDLAVESFRRTRDPHGFDRVCFSARASIDRRDFGLTGNVALDSGGLVIGERLDVQIEGEAVRQVAVYAA